MGYSDGEALILTRVRNCSSFDADNTSRGNWLILNAGKGSGGTYAVLRPGEYDPRDWLTFSQDLIRWTTYIEVWQRYKDDTDTRSDLESAISEIITELRQYPHQGDATKILDSDCQPEDEPKEMWTRSGGPGYLMWRIKLEWQEVTNVTFQE